MPLQKQAESSRTSTLIPHRILATSRAGTPSSNQSMRPTALTK
jgi:hypothetical protein